MDELNLQIPINTLGMGMHGLGYYKVLKMGGIKVNVEPITPVDDTTEGEIRSLCENLELDYGELMMDVARPGNPDIPELIVWHPGNLRGRPYVGSTVTACVTFETTAFQFHEHSSMNSVDRVVTCSDWGRKVLEDAGIEDAGVLHGPAWPLYLKNTHRSEIISAVWEQLKLPGIERCALSVGKWESRKMHQTVVGAMGCRKFFASPNMQDIVLVGCWNNMFVGGLNKPVKYLTEMEFAVERVINTPMGHVYLFKHRDPDNRSKILVLPHVPGYRDILAIYGKCLHFLCASAGEGWNLPLVDAMALGLQCTATSNTAHTEYITSKNAAVIGCSEEVAEDGIWFRSDRGNWFPPIMAIGVNTAYGLTGNLRWNTFNAKQAAIDIERICAADVLCDDIMTTCYETSKDS